MHNIKKFIKRDEFYINIWKNKINIVNFKDIVVLENNKIVLTCPNGKITIKGNNLCINKLLDSEILLSGKIEILSFGD